MPGDYGGFEKVLRVGEGRRGKRLTKQAEYIGTLEPEFEALTDEELRGKTAEFKQRLENGETLDELLFEAFAADGRQLFGTLAALERRGEREGRDYAVHAERLDGDFWEVRAAAL